MQWRHISTLKVQNSIVLILTHLVVINYCHITLWLHIIAIGTNTWLLWYGQQPQSWLTRKQAAVQCSSSPIQPNLSALSSKCSLWPAYESASERHTSLSLTGNHSVTFTRPAPGSSAHLRLYLYPACKCLIFSICLLISCAAPTALLPLYRFTPIMTTGPFLPHLQVPRKKKL